jgi:hypothetical protein
MPHVASFARRSAAFACLAGGVLFTVVARAQALEVHFTGVLTAVNVVPGAMVGDTVSGSMSFAAGALVTTATDGATYNSASHETTSPLSSAIVTLQNGTVFETGTHAGVQDTGVDLQRDYPNPHPGTNNYALSSGDEFGPDNPTAVLIQLAVADFLGPASSIFSTPDGDLSLLQPVDWFAAGATNIRQFNSGISSGQFTLTSLEVVTASPVPEPATLALLAAGLLAVRGRVKGSRRTTA